MLTRKRLALPNLAKFAEAAKSDEGKAAYRAMKELHDAMQDHFRFMNAPGGLSVVQSGVWTPTVTASSGTLTTATATGRYWKIQDELYFYYIEATVTTAGTGTGVLRATLPFTITEDLIGIGADVTVSFKAATVTGGSGASLVSILGADATSIIADGAVLRCMGMWVVED